MNSKYLVTNKLTLLLKCKSEGNSRETKQALGRAYEVCMPDHMVTSLELCNHSRPHNAKKPSKMLVK
jgi:hypothetical protein